eukprot:6185862-Pleurochrysis_carterae.AAC.3
MSFFTSVPVCFELTIPLRWACGMTTAFLQCNLEFAGNGVCGCDEEAARARVATGGPAENVEQSRGAESIKRRASVGAECRVRCRDIGGAATTAIAAQLRRARPDLDNLTIIFDNSNDERLFTIHFH